VGPARRVGVGVGGPLPLFRDFPPGLAVLLAHVELFADLGDAISGDLEGLIDEEFA
jgi:hypothetical protein